MINARMSMPLIAKTGQVAVEKDSASTKENAGPVVIENQESGRSSSSTNTSISGRALLLFRLFNKSNENDVIPVETNTIDSAITGSKSIFNWLTNEDRATLEKAYEHASSNAMDLRYVDDLGADMAMYRYSKSVTYGDIYDLEGHKLTFDFTDADKKIADRIMSGDAVNETQIDRGFLTWILDSSKPNHAVKFEFLESLIHELPASGANEGSVYSDSSTNFKSYIGGPNEIVTHVSDEVDTYYTSFKPQYVSINGVGRWLTDDQGGDAENIKNSVMKNILEQHESQSMSFLRYLIGEGQNKSNTKI